MNTHRDSHSATLVDLLAGVATLLDDCSQIAGDLEHAIGDWLTHSADPVAFPVEELQHIDLLRQIQNDLTTLLGSEELARDVRQKQNRVDIPTIVGLAKLERVRARLIRLSSGNAPAGAVLGKAGRNGDVDLF